MPRSVAGGGGPKKKRKAPSKPQLAHRQARTYGSQGRQIQTQARRQRRAARPTPVSQRPTAFRPLPTSAGRNAPFHVQQQRQHRRTERARRNLPDHPGIPHVPTLKRYTKPQRDLIRRIYHNAAKRETGSRSFTALYDLGSKRQREQMRGVFAGIERSERPAVERARRDRPSLFKELKAGQRKTSGAKLFGTLATSEIGKRLRTNAQIPGGGNLGNVRDITKPIEAAAVGTYNIGRATVEDPAAVARSSLRTAKESIAGIPQGVKMLVEDPEKALKMMADDYERRYGSILSDPAKFREMVKKDYGVTPFVLDATALAGGAGVAGGAVARTGTFGQLARLPGKAGTAARILHEASRGDKARPRLRFSAGKEGTRVQEVSRNLFVALGQRGLDARRGRRYTSRVRKAGFAENANGTLSRLADRSALPGRLPGLRPGRGEVVGRGLRDVGPWRGLTGRIQRDVGQTKSTTRLRMLTHRGRVMREIEKTTSKLTRAEKIGTALMLKYGVRSGRESLATLRKRLAQIDTEDLAKLRDEMGLDDAEVRALREVINNPEEYLTSNAKAAATDLKHIQLREVENDPGLADDQEIIRRFSQQAELLDVPRTLKSGEAAPDVNELERLKQMIEDSAEQQRKTGLYKFGKGNEVHLQRQANELGKIIERLKAGDDPDFPPALGGKRADVSGMPLAKAVAQSSLRKADDTAGFVGRVQKAAREAKLDEPAYWMSTAEAGTGARLAAVGTGLKATERNRQYTGSLYRMGAEDIGLDVFTQGVERNIKRRFQWQMVARNIDTHAYEWSRNRGQGSTFSQLASEMRKRRIDPDTIDFVPATIVKRRPDEEAGIQRGRPTDTVPEGEEFGDVHEAIRERKTFDQLANEDVQGAQRDRYFAVPKEVGEILEAATKPSGATARTLEIILKQKPTRIMLGALNVPWLGFQVVSNGMLTGLGGGLKPWDIYGSYKWFRGLDPEMKEAVEAELGITHGHHFALDQPHLGDTKLPVGIRHISNFYRAYKRSKVGRGLHKVNPLDLMFRADEAQNNFWRKTLFYSKAKKDAYRRMGGKWRAIDEAQGALIEKVFKLPPHEQLRAVAENADLFEKHAKHVRDWLGDYTRFSNAERKLLSANVLFYGYLRFSLRFAFYTMPVQHPIMADMIGNIGRLGAQDVKRLFGVPSNYNLPTSMMAQSYFGTPKDARRGTLESLNFGRMNPFLNAVTQMESLRQAAGLVSPVYQALLDQAFEESSFTGRDWRIEGRPTPGEAERPRNYFGSPLSLLNPGAYSIPGVSEGRPRNRILQNQLLSMAFPYRLGEQIGIPGIGVEPLASSQSDDALLWEPRPMRYKDEEAAAGVRRTRREERKRGTEERLLQGLSFMPKVTAAPQVIEREREKEADQRNRSTGRKKPRRKSRYGGGSSRYGGSSSNRYGG